MLIKIFGKYQEWLFRAKYPNIYFSWQIKRIFQNENQTFKNFKNNNVGG